MAGVVRMRVNLVEKVRTGFPEDEMLDLRSVNFMKNEKKHIWGWEQNMQRPWVSREHVST